MTYNEMVMRAYGATVSYGDHETAAMLGWKRVGFRILLAGSLVLALCLVSCKQDSAATMAPSATVNFAQVASSLITPLDLTPGTVFHHYKIDVGVTFVGQDANGNVILDIRVDGSQNLRAVTDPSQFVQDVYKSPDWYRTTIATPVNSSDR